MKLSTAQGHSYYLWNPTGSDDDADAEEEGEEEEDGEGEEEEDECEESEEEEVRPIHKRPGLFFFVAITTEEVYSCMLHIRYGNGIRRLTSCIYIY